MKQLLKYILSLTIEHQKIAETKHSITLALSSGVIVLISSSITPNVYQKTLCLVSIALCVVAIMFNFFALISKSIVIKRQSFWNKKQSNLTYFKHISKLDFEEYKYLLLQNYGFPQDYEIDYFESDLIKQVMALSKRVNAKYELFNISATMLFLGIVFGFVGLVFKGVIWAIFSITLTNG